MHRIYNFKGLATLCTQHAENLGLTSFFLKEE